MKEEEETRVRTKIDEQKKKADEGDLEWLEKKVKKGGGRGRRKKREEGVEGQLERSLNRLTEWVEEE